MRVGLVIYGSLTALSGGYLYDRRLVERLRQCGDEVRIYALPNQPYGCSLLDNFLPGLLTRLARAPIDLLLQDELNHPSLFLLNRRLRSRVSYPVHAIVHHLRCQEPHRGRGAPFYRAVERAYLRSVDGLVCSSRTTADEVERLLGREVTKLVATPGGDRLGVVEDVAVISERVAARGPLRLLFLGNLTPRKGLRELLRALTQAREQPWELTVVGSRRFDRRYAEEVEQQAARGPLAGKVEFRGSLTDSELRRTLASSHLLAMPFAFEGFGIVYLEAMAFGVPALASTTGGAREVVGHGVTGYLFAPGDLAGVAAVVERFQRERRALLDFSLAARSEFGKFPGWRDTTLRVRGFLESEVRTHMGEGRRRGQV
jgi:glycosyltransferase involved in cell wall biosynthesis